MLRDKLEITKEDAIDLANDEYDDTIYEVISDKIDGSSRWSIEYELVVKTLADGRYWKSYYSRGATESQDEGPYEYGDPEFTEVFPKQVEVTIYE